MSINQFVACLCQDRVLISVQWLLSPVCVIFAWRWSLFTCQIKELCVFARTFHSVQLVAESVWSGFTLRVSKWSLVGCVCASQWKQSLFKHTASNICRYCHNHGIPLLSPRPQKIHIWHFKLKQKAWISKPQCGVCLSVRDYSESQQEHQSWRNWRLPWTVQRHSWKSSILTPMLLLVCLYMSQSICL